MTISQIPTSVAEPVDRMSPLSSTWERGISLEPAEPRLRELIARTFRQFALNAPDDQSRAHAIALAEKWSEQP